MRSVVFSIVMYLVVMLLCVLGHHFFPNIDLSPIINCLSLVMGVNLTSSLIWYYSKHQYLE